MLVVGPSDVQQASALLSDLGIKIMSGGRFLGGFIGEPSLVANFVSDKVQLWSRCVQRLSDVATSQPQAAHAALARSLQFEWCHLQRVIPDSANFFTPLRDALNDVFYPILLGGSVSGHEVRLFGFPARFGGLGISDPVKSADLAFSSSREGSSVLVDSIHGVTEFSVTAHLDLLARVHNDISRRREVDVQSALSSLLELLPSPVCRTVRRDVDFQTSGWLTVLPLACHQFDLSAQQFHDALSLRYHRPLSMMPFLVMGVVQLLAYHMHWIVAKVVWLHSATMRFEMLWVIWQLWLIRMSFVNRLYVRVTLRFLLWSLI